VPEGDRDAMRGAAQKGITRWHTFMVTSATPAQAGIARIARRSYQLAWEQCE